MAFDLRSISKAGSRAKQPLRMVVYGTAGVGKTTFATRRAATIVLPTEDGLTAINDVDAFSWNDGVTEDGIEINPRRAAKSFAEVKEAVQGMIDHDHDYKHLVLDSADWCEKLIEHEVATDKGLKEFSLQAKELAYGAGNRCVAQKWAALLQQFDVLRNKRGMAITIVAHSQVKRFDDPTTDAYDRYTLDLNKESAATLSEWCDVLAFAGFRVSVKEEQVGINGKKKRGISSGERFLFTQETPAFVAKTRYYLGDGPLPLDFDVFSEALTAAQS